MSGSSSSGSLNQQNAAFFSVLLPDLQSQLANQFQFSNLTTLQNFAEQFSSSTEYLQLSTAQIALSTDDGSYTLLIQGTGMSIPGATLLGLLNPGSISLSSVAGTITAAELYSGGTFNTSSGAVSGGTVIASATFSATEMTVTSGAMEMVIDGTNLPTAPATVGAIEKGTYSGPAIGVSSIEILNNGSQVGSLTVGVNSLTLVSDDYKLVLNGTFPTSLSSSLIDSLVGSGNFSALHISLASAQLSRVSTGQILLNVPNITIQEFTGINLQDIPGTIASIAAAASVGDSVSFNTGTMQTPLDATLNGSTIEVAGTAGAAALGFFGDSAITGANPSVDGQGTISNLIPGQNGAGTTVLDAAGRFVNQGSVLADGPAGSTFTIDVEQNTTNGVTTEGGFYNDGAIRVGSGNRMTIAIAAGAELFNAGTLLADGGSLFIDALPGAAGGGYAQQPGYAVIENGGTIETNATGTASLSGATDTFLFADGAAGDTLKIDAPAQFGGRILGFRSGDTIDLGGSLAIGQIVYDSGSGILDLDNSGGTILGALAIEGLSLPSGTTVTVNPTTGVAGSLDFTTGADGDTLLTTGASNTVTVTTGTLQTAFDQTLNASTIDIAGIGSAAVLTFTGDNGITYANPSVDGTSLIASLVPGQSAAGMTSLTASGRFVNQGTILADGPAGSTFTVNVQQSDSGIAAVPGYFINYGTIQVDVGNRMTINIGGTSALFNAGWVIADGGSLLVNAATNAVDSGYAGIASIAEIEGGGTIETNGTYPPASGFFTPQYVFVDGTAGNTLKIDNIREFDGNIRGFGVGDTIDLGTALSVGTIVFGSTIGPFGMLAMENSSGTVVASLQISGIYPDGTFAVAGGQADGFNFTTGADGDTLLTTTVPIDTWLDTSGALPAAGDWSLNNSPGSLIAEIGLNSTSPFTVTTGTAAVATGPLLLGDPNALLQITSTTSVIGGGVSQLGGMVEVTDGNTLTALSLTEYSANSLLLLDPGSTLDVLGLLNSNATNNGTIGVTSGGTIGVRVAGAMLINGGTLNAGAAQPVAGASGGSFYLGYGYPGTPATVTVENGGVVSDTYASLGSDPTSFGILTLSGAGTTWSDEIDPNDPLNSRGYMIVGVNDLAQNTPPGVAQPPYAGTAQVIVENGATLNDTRAFIGDSLDSAGFVLVTSGGQWNIGPITGGYLVLSAGGQATLSVTNGGTVNVGGNSQYLSNGVTVNGSGGILVGFTAGTGGTIIVSDTNSLLTDAGGMELGVFSQGTLDVLNSGTVDIWGNYILAGYLAGATGSILVSGAGSELFAPNAEIEVGVTGTAQLAVQADGLVQTFSNLYLGGIIARTSALSAGAVSIGTGGSLEAANLFLWAGSTISVDATSGIDLGYDGSYTPGAVNIEPYSALAGDGLVAANVVNDGTIEATNNSTLSSSTGGKLEIEGAVTGTGSMIIAPGATLQVDGALGADQAIVFSPGTSETLILSSTVGPISNAITGFAQGDKIELADGVTVYPPTFTTLANFQLTNYGGDYPGYSLIEDAAGNLLGALNGPTYVFGYVFEIAKTAGGYASTPSTVAIFNGNNGSGPEGGLIADTAGDLLGATQAGGANDDGVAYEIAKTSGGYASTPNVLVNLSGANIEGPQAGLVADAAGDLFGTTLGGGANGDGSVFELVNVGGGTYTVDPLASFTGTDGYETTGSLIMDVAGNLFGTTASDGPAKSGGVPDGDGTVFELIKNDGTYESTPTTLVTFNGTNGSVPVGGVTADGAGDLFGTTFSGTVFEIVKTGSGYASTPTTLVTFNGGDGYYPGGGVIVDAAGNLFGTTSGLGPGGGGTVFEIANTSTGYATTPSTLVNFNGTNGSAPGALIADGVGDLFGTTLKGGVNGDGTVFEIANSGFVGAVTEQGSTITADPQSGQAVSLNQVIANASVVPTGTIQALLIDGPGIVSVIGTVAINDLDISSGQLALSGATVNTDPVTIYANGDISGYGTVTGALTNLGTITANGGTLELTGSVTGMGSLVVDPGATLLLDLGASSGAVTVDSGGLIAAGELDVGEAGFGGLLIENRATVATGTIAINGAQGLDISETVGGTGDAIVTGIGSRLDNSGEFVVGDGGLGSLSIESDGTVITTPGTTVGLAGAVIANQSGAGGSSVNVTGEGSDWQVGGALDVGDAATGVLAISNGAAVSATTLDAGVGASGAGIVTVSGPDADLITAGTVTIGDAGSGELSILDGANATIGGDLDIANAGTGTGNVDIEDTTGTITFGGNIFVGFNGFGVFNIGYNVDYIQNNGGIIFGPDSSGAINSFPDPSPFLSNSSPSPISIGAQGVDQLAAYLFNSGEFTIPNNHSLTFDTPIIYGGGSFSLGSGDSLVLNADTVTGQTFTLGSNDKLTIGIDQLATIDLPASGTGPFTPEANPNKGDLLLGNFGGVIANFTSGDTIDVDTHLSSAAAGTLSQNAAVVSVIEIANGATLGVLTFDTAANAAAAVADGAIVLEAAPCFAAGTRIATERGEVAVEAIEVGDRVRMLLGGRPDGDGFAEVIWVGRREVDCAGHAQPRKVWPVRIVAGAFGPGRPHSDVLLSPDHAVFVNEVLIPIRHLINGSTIVQVKTDRVTYHHIELAEHDVLLAQGLPAESFLDMRDGSKYANRPGPVRLYPDFSVRMWEAFGCARLIVTGPELGAARALVAGFARARAAA